MRQYEEAPYMPGKPRFNSVYLMAYSGARGNMDQVRQLSAMRGLMSRPQKKISGQVGEIIETPVVSNFREGLSILEYFISTHGGRKGLADTALKTADAGYLTRRLVDVAHHVVVTEEDCGTIKGIKVSALKVGDEVIEPLEERIYGRVVLNDIVVDEVDEKTGEIRPKVIVREGEMITKEQAKKIVEAGIESIRIRSVLTCESKEGVCAKCYGMDLSRGELVKVGEAVGIVAAQSIGEPGTQLTLRTFHIGGAVAKVIKQPKITAPFDGVVEHHNFKVVKKKEADKEILVVITTNAVIRLVNEQTRQRQSWELPYGTRVFVPDKARVKKGQLVAEWDAYSIPIVAERSGKVVYQDLIEGKTLITERRRAMGGAEKRVLPYKGKINPRLNIVNEKGKIVATYSLPVDAVILVEDEEEVVGGDIIAKIPREEIKTKDITGGLPRVEELFEARHPKNAAVISEIDGRVKVTTVERKDKEGKTVIDTIITIKNEKSGKEKTYTLPPGRHLLVYEGDKVEAGEPLTDGVIDPHKYLEVRGPQHTQEFLLNEIQQVYRLQGVVINDKHIEIIIKQMLSYVRIIDPGLPPKPRKDKRFYEFIYGEIVPRKLFEQEVEKIEEERKLIRKEKGPSAEELKQIRPPKAEPVLLGISKVAGSSESCLYAESFQATSRVLTEAA
ncbi:MAG: DNA-directed RNA polymerase subunit beta', partial [Candidatus Aenigmatarchaeota archaeon]